MAVRGLHNDLDILQSSYRHFPDQGGSEEDEDEEGDDEGPPHFQAVGGRQGTGWTQGPGPGAVAGEGETPNVMIHLVPEAAKSRWTHIDDLDSFFTKVYDYHQKHGFTVMMLQEILELAQFIFIVFFTVFMAECVNYPVLFKDKIPDGKPHKLTLRDVVTSTPFSSMHFLTQTFIFVSVLFWVTRLIVVVYHVFQFWDIKCFYNTALRIPDSELDSVTWWEVQQRLVQAQKEHMMCIHKQELTPLDVYHRILRFNNYIVAMVNKAILPLRYSVPFLGDSVFLSSGLKFNIELVLFKSPWAPFNQWHLREDFKRVAKRKELADSLRTHILVLGCVNLVLMPVILLWQILYSFFNYAEVIKREPGSLGVRKWSLYARYYLRHFNELEHELSARLSRAYKPATHYMDIFVSPLATVIAKNVAFICGSVLAVAIMLTVWDEDVLNVEHLLTVMTVLGAAVAGARVFIPDENLVFCPEKTLTQVIAHIHYFPLQWRGQAHTYQVMTELDQLFRYTALFLLDELLSPVVTPLVLIFGLSHRTQEIVDFFRNFTVDVVGVGDVCSFAQMDVRKHGHPGWQVAPEAEQAPKTNQYTQAEHGKTEMSLLHFTLTNPGWKPTGENERYLAGVKEAKGRDLAEIQLQEVPSEAGAMQASIQGLETLGGSYRSLAQSLLHSVPSPPPPPVPSPPPPPVLRGGLARLAGPSMASSSSMLGAHRPPSPLTGLEYSQADMALSALYLHNVNHRAAARPSLGQLSAYNFQEEPMIDDNENAPLLRVDS